MYGDAAIGGQAQPPEQITEPVHPERDTDHALERSIGSADPLGQEEHPQAGDFGLGDLGNVEILAGMVPVMNEIGAPRGVSLLGRVADRTGPGNSLDIHVEQGVKRLLGGILAEQVEMGLEHLVPGGFAEAIDRPVSSRV